MEDMTLKRSMFMMPLKSGTMNSGIMQGFEEEEDDDEVMSSAELTRRTPQSPEILMNNLRGDMRSVDARYEELAQMVGDEAAMETPPEVLALLQGQMAAGAGIGQLPQGQQMMPPPMMPPEQQMMPPEAGMMPPEQGMMDQGPGPTDQGGIGAMMPPPQGFAEGGYVQHFSNGSGPMGVSPIDRLFTDEQLSGMGYDVAAERNLLDSLNAQLGYGFLNEPGLQDVVPEAYLFGGLKAGQLGLRGARQLGSKYFQPSIRQVPNLGQGGPRMIMEPARGITGMARDALSGLKTGAKDIGSLLARNPKTSAAVVGLPALSLAGSRFLGPEEGQETTTADIPAPKILPAGPMDPGVTGEARPGVTGEAVAGGPAGAVDATTAFLQQAGQTKPEDKLLTRAERAKGYAEEYMPFFREFLPENKDAMQAQALLLLAKAAAEFGSSREPSAGMALGKALSETLAPGLGQLAAQKSEREERIRLLALQSGMEDAAAEDAQNLKLLELRAQAYKDLMAGRKTERLPNGDTIIKDKTGNILGRTGPGNQNALEFRMSAGYRDPETYPFAVRTGTRLPYIEDEKTQRKLIEDQALFSQLALEAKSLEKLLQDGYGPGSFVTDIYGRLIAPVVPGAPEPTLTPEAKGRIEEASKRFRSLLMALRGTNSGNPSNFDVKDAAAQSLLAPATLFGSRQRGALELRRIQAMIETDLNYVGNKLGYLDEVVMFEPPPTGTKDDPFIMPEAVSINDPRSFGMYRYLGEIGSLAPKAQYYVMQNNELRPVTGAQLQNIWNGIQQEMGGQR